VRFQGRQGHPASVTSAAAMVSMDQRWRGATVDRPPRQPLVCEGQAVLIAETSNSRVILSLTRTPPVSSAAFQVMP
jgi:hypothetical protein